MLYAFNEAVQIIFNSKKFNGSKKSFLRNCNGMEFETVLSGGGNSIFFKRSIISFRGLLLPIRKYTYFIFSNDRPLTNFTLRSSLSRSTSKSEVYLIQGSWIDN